PRRRRRSGGLIQGERREDARALRTPAAERDLNVGPGQRDRGAVVEEVDGERRRFGEAALEPLAIAVPRPLEHEAGVERRVGFQLAHHQRGGLRARPPVDESRVVAEAVLSQIVEAVTAAAARRRTATRAVELTAAVVGDRADRWIHDDLRVRLELARLDEQAER